MNTSKFYRHSYSFFPQISKIFKYYKNEIYQSNLLRIYYIQYTRKNMHYKLPYSNFSYRNIIMYLSLK